MNHDMFMISDCTTKLMQFVEDKRGFSTHHLGLVYTLFSASNYCGTAGNKAVGFWIGTSKDLPD